HIFFFSSRRRHTSSKRDWSSDVCSSDLTPSAASRSLGGHRRRHLRAVDDHEQHDPTGPQPSQASETQAPGIPLEELLTALIDAAHRGLGADWENRLAQMLATLRHRLSGEYEIADFGRDPELTRIMATAFEPIAEKWFRLQVRGSENVPYDGGALVVANHSGTVPVDGLMTGFAVQKHAGRYMRPLGAD